MFEFLVYATLGVVAIIVLVLAFTLISVAIALSRAAGHVRAIAGGLEAVDGYTSPLGEYLTTINGALVKLLNGLGSADGHLATVARALGLEK
ncbi:MAG: hypothetical protein M3Z07_03520 [Candidatus Eremiobacteraeota bacterium]|nr:hypothetical protein [Candidatus Eremiobacteraeota bacterium]